MLRRATPVVVNSFNQLTYTRNLLEKLTEAGFANLYVVDQHSSDPALLDYLAGVNASGAALVLFASENNGPHHFFAAGLHHSLLGGAPFLYTDPDLSWDTLAPDFLSKLFDTAYKYAAFKVGPALALPSAEEAKPVFCPGPNGKATIFEHEGRYWEKELEAGVFDAPIDTTLHLFIPALFPGGTVIAGLRVAGEGFSVKHLPWFKDDPMPARERDFYLARSSYTTWNL